MGITYSAGIAFGYSFSAEELRRAFGVHVAEQSHLERRFDPKTGVELPKAKVVDVHEGQYLRFGEEEMEYLPELCEAICDKIGCSYSGINAYDEEPDSIIFGIYPKKKLDDGIDYGNISSGNSYYFTDVVALGPKLEELGEKLKSIGLEPGPVGVFSTMDVY